MTLRRPFVIVALTALLGLVTAAAFSASGRSNTREVVLVARGMAFYVDGESVPNPEIRLHAGERVRLTVRNESPGLVHDLTSEGLGVTIEPIEAGERRTVTFTAPPTAGRHEYVCRPHAVMMRGWIEVAAP